jgi:hypothetical protein
VIVHSADVLRAVKAQWDRAVPADLVPGGLHHGRVPEGVDPTRPYASVMVEEADYLFPSGAQYLQAFDVTLSVWSQAGPTDAGAIRRAIDVCFDRDRACHAGAQNGLGELEVPGGLVIDLEPLPSMIEEDEATKDGKEVMLTRRRWRLWVQATR